MTLAVGVRIGGYEITGHVGSGGMGEVYRARDLTLQRDVAIKILPEGFGADLDRVARFEREARTLASLNHPYIAQIYGFEKSETSGALIMELVDGEDLSQRLARGALPIDDALPIARHIAEALGAAHAAGIIHRDLKPANVKVRPDGTVKVLDFGLAKALDQTAGTTKEGVLLANSPTITTPAMTAAGMILGTAAYMAPEQAKGKVADQRSDVWAFGCVLFEMVSGRRAFGGEDVSDTLANVLKSEPDWQALPAITPPALRRLLRRCLAKDPRKRISAMADALLDVDDAEHDDATTGNDSLVHPTRSTRMAGWGALAAVAVIGAALAARYQQTPPRVVPPPVRLAIASTPSINFAHLLGNAAPFQTVSPDGKSLAFIARSEGTDFLHVRALDGVTSQRLPGTERASTPFWSPDSRFIAFNADGKLRTVAATGGAVQTIADVAASGGGSWSSQDVIVFSPTSANGLVAIPAKGGTLRDVTKVNPAENELGHRWPQFLPDGNRFLYLSLRSGGTAAYLGRLDGQPPKKIVDADTRVVYAPPGYLLYVRRGRLLAQPFNLDEGTLGGDPAALAEDVASVATNGRAAFSVSSNGILAYTTVSTSAAQLVWFSRDGVRLRAAGSPGQFSNVAVSRDGQQLALDVYDPRAGSYDVWVFDTRDVPTRLTTGVADERGGQWSPDSTAIAYYAAGAGAARLMIKSLVDGTERPGPNVPGPPILEDWSWDGKNLLVLSSGNLWAVPIASEPPRVVASSAQGIDEPQFSPNGNLIAYAMETSGQFEIYVQPFDAPGRPTRVSVGGATQPKWRADGKELYYLTVDGDLMAVSITNDTPVQLSAPTKLFQVPFGVSTATDQYGVSLDGKQFVLLVPVASNAPTALDVLVNWPSLLSK